MNATPAAALVLTTLVVGAFSTGAHAQRRRSTPPPAEVELSPYGDSPYRYVFSVRPRSGSADVVADRRLLSFVVRPPDSRRRYRCRHPAAPRRVDEARIRSLPDADGERVYREWFDLRMYCSGRARRALVEGATVEATYGFRGGGRTRWVARQGEDARPVRSLDAGEVTIRPAPAAAPSPTEGAERPPLRLTMSDVSVRTGGYFSFNVALRTTEGSTRVYLRNDLASFRVSGPLGAVTCRVPTQRIVPIVDFYQRISTRVAARTTAEARRWCPEDTFDVAGIYEVTPVVDLIYDNRNYDFDAAVGEVVGEPAVVRVSVGDRGYVEQVPEPGAGRAPGPAS